MAKRDSLLGTVVTGVALALVGVIFLWAGTRPADAAFPGQNGEIFYTGTRLMCDPRFCWDDLRYDSDIYAVNPDGSGLTNLTNSPNTTDRYPAVSPDGSRVAFVRDGDLWVMNAEGSEPRRLASGDWPEASPTWSPDGTEVAFVKRSERFVAGLEVFVVNVDGSGERRLTRNSLPEYALSWSPDGTKIALVAPPENDVYGQHEIYSMNADGSGLRMLTGDEDPGPSGHPEWSPDGTKIAYYGMWLFDDYWTSGTILMDADGSDKRYLSPHEDVAFSPDGTKMASGGDGIYVMNADGGGEPTRITDAADGGFNGDEESDYSPDWGAVCPCPEPPDTVGPTVTRPEPAPGSEVRDRTPAIRAVVRDESSELLRDDIKLYVDGVRKSSSYDPGTGRLSRTSGRLSRGRHFVKVNATDRAGNRASKVWSFRVVGGG